MRWGLPCKAALKRKWLIDAQPRLSGLGSMPPWSSDGGASQYEAEPSGKSGEAAEASGVNSQIKLVCESIARFFPKQLYKMFCLN